MTSEVSNTTIAILLVLTILVSAVGTWTVLDAAKQVGPAPMQVIQAPLSEGKIQLEVAGVQGEVATNGKVSLVIVK